MPLLQGRYPYGPCKHQAVPPTHQVQLRSWGIQR
uniref:Uncharacterized protein n=1 Tax=Arundo donax TaxID=35708 RepID=A0A0A9GYB3_ARUDO